MKNNNARIGRNPTGLIGTVAGRVMNMIHKGQYADIIHSLKAEVPTGDKETSVLDVGCGGGKAVALFCKIFEDSKVVGVDHSNEMVNLSRRINRKYIKAGRAMIIKGEVSDLPLTSSRFNLVTAFDTINLWDDIEASIAEIKRVITPEGLFVIVNAYPKEGSKWLNMVRFKSDKGYIAFLEDHGFIVKKFQITRNTIVITCRKNK
jgi:ubiquinone/menaquinone biosynthesis C-methylase UbiE